MNIEVTQKTFDLIFKNINYSSSKNLELGYKEFFFNKEIEQNGIIVVNYINDTKQYFLTDINA